jgi:hypothetical protein
MENKMNTFTARVEYDEETDEYILPLTDEVCNELGWHTGDTIDWKDNGDGSYILTKVQKKVATEKVLVETVSTFRMRYVVEVPVGKKEWALDTVTMNEAEEFSQEHIGEQIVSHRVIDNEEYLRVFNEDNDYLKSWSDEQKFKFVTPLPEDEIEHSPSYFDFERNK